MWFIDFEASSLSQTSYPIEVGLAYLDLTSMEITEGHSLLILPEKSWTDWDDESQKIHGITRGALTLMGEDATSIAERLNTILSGQTILCDSPRYDGFWCRRLFESVGVEQRFTIISMWDPLTNLMWDAPIEDGVLFELRAKIAEIFARPNPHRAEKDARLLADGYSQALGLLAAHK